MATDAPCYTPRFNTPSRRDAIGRVGRLAEQDAWASCAKSRLERGGGEQKGAMALPLYLFFQPRYCPVDAAVEVICGFEIEMLGTWKYGRYRETSGHGRTTRAEVRREKNTVITDISKQFENGRAGLVMHCSVKVKVKKTDKAKRRLALSGQQRLWRWRAPESVPGLDPCRRRANHEAHLCWKHNAPGYMLHPLYSLYSVHVPYAPTPELPLFIAAP